jgi:hypothetical protein
MDNNLRDANCNNHTRSSSTSLVKLYLHNIKALNRTVWFLSLIRVML